MVKLFVEGGGDHKSLKNECRKGFREFLKKAGVHRQLKIIASGSRKQAFDDFCTALNNHEDAFLLVDSESAINAKYNKPDFAPWGHLNARPGDQWQQPAQAKNEQCHLMVECMENWFLADPDALKKHFGSKAKLTNLAQSGTSIEAISKTKALQQLDKLAKNKQEGKYHKGKHSFALLGAINPEKVINSSPWAKRFITELNQYLNTKS